MIVLNASLRALLQLVSFPKRGPAAPCRRSARWPAFGPAASLTLPWACLLACSLAAAELAADVNALMRAADGAVKQKNYSEAIQLAGKAMVADPKDARPLLLRAHAYNGVHDFAKAVADYNAALQINPQTTLAYQRRGEAQFRLGHFKESIADFDKFIELMPEQGPQHW